MVRPTQAALPVSVRRLSLPAAVRKHLVQPVLQPERVSFDVVRVDVVGRQLEPDGHLHRRPHQRKEVGQGRQERGIGGPAAHHRNAGLKLKSFSPD